MFYLILNKRDIYIFQLEKMGKMTKQIQKSSCCMLAFFTVITIHKKIETRGISKLCLSSCTVLLTYFTFSYVNNKLLQKIFRKPGRTRKDC